MTEHEAGADQIVIRLDDDAPLRGSVEFPDGRVEFTGWVSLLAGLDVAITHATTARGGRSEDSAGPTDG